MGEVAVGSEMTREGARDHVLVSRPLLVHLGGLTPACEGVYPRWG